MLRIKFANIKRPLRRGRWVVKTTIMKGWSNYDWTDGLPENRSHMSSITEEVFEVDTTSGLTCNRGKAENNTCPSCGNYSRDYVRHGKCNICERPTPIWDKSYKSSKKKVDKWKGKY